MAKAATKTSRKDAESPEGEEKVKKERKPRKQKPALTKEHGEQDEEGRFTVVPQVEGGLSNFARLKKKEFANEAAYFRYQAALVQERMAGLQEQIDSYNEQAELEEKYGNDEARKKAKRLAARRREVAKLEAELEDLGIDIEDEFSSLGGSPPSRPPLYDFRVYPVVMEKPYLKR